MARRSTSLDPSTTGPTRFLLSEGEVASKLYGGVCRDAPNYDLNSNFDSSNRLKVRKYSENCPDLAQFNLQH